MGDVVVGETIQRVTEGGQHRTSAVFAVGDGHKEAAYTTSATVPFVVGALGDIWLPPALMIAMVRGDNLVLADPISAGRLDDIERFQDVFLSWYPTELHRVSIRADVEEPPALTDASVPAPVTASCFTGGVDSFHALMTRRERIGALIYAFGVDVPMSEVKARRRVGELLVRVSESLGLQLLTTTTNIRRIIGPEVSWGFYAHGAALASVATIFSGVTNDVIIPASHTYATPIRWGSNPLIDPLWSTRRLAIEHVGAEAGRTEKLRLIADHQVVRENLRVCYKKFDELNCGECMKCLRTMVGLTILDQFEHFESFSKPLDLDLFTSFPLRTENDFHQISDIAAALKTMDGHKDIAAAAQTLLEGYDARISAGQGPWLPGDEA